jgi:hypothetical protein
MEYVLQAADSRTSLSFPHASSGNPGGIRTGPPIKTFGGDDLSESHLFTSAAIFQAGHEAYEERKDRSDKRMFFKTFVPVAFLVVQVTCFDGTRRTEWLGKIN